MQTQNRINNIIKALVEKNIYQILISNPFDIFYLTRNFIEPGERFLCLYINTDGEKKFFINQLFTLGNKFPEDLEVVCYSDNDNPIKIISKTIKDNLTLVDKNFPAKFLLPMLNLNQRLSCPKCFISNVLENARLIKDQQEIDFMRESSKLNDLAMDLLIKNIRADQTELELVDILNHIKQDLNINKFSFDPIIAFGKNAAQPHHVPDKTKLKPGDCIVIDIGFIKNNYCSDMTRTVFFKYVSDFDKNIYDIVLKANRLAIEKVKPGVKFSDIDLEARNYIKQNGYEKNFIHTTGHSIGLECHEYGTVSSRNHDIIKQNMIFSIEPGIYLKNKFGVRIEDLVLVTKNGYEVLNKFNKNIIIVP